MTGEGVVKRLDRGALLLRGKHPALELERAEAPSVDHGPCLRDDGVRSERLAPRVVIGAGVTGPLVEEVAAERHAVAHRPAEQVGHRAVGLTALHVEARDLERRVDRVDRRPHVEHAAEARPGAADLAAEGLVDEGAQAVQVVGIVAR